MNLKKLRDIREDLIFVGPAFAVFFIIVVTSFILGIYYSFTEWNGVGKVATWVGLENYLYIFQEDPGVAGSAWYTIRFTLTCTVLSNLLGLSLALALTQSLRGTSIYRAIFFLPNVIGGIILGFIWRFIFGTAFGSLADITNFGFFQLPWLGTPATGFWATVIVFVWKTTGYLMVIYIAAIVTIDETLIEAATIDGASWLQRTFRITLPLITPAFTVCLFLMLSWSSKLFDVIFSLTKGGPFGSTEAFALNIYREAFDYNNYGLASAKAVLFFLVVGAITVSQVNATKRLEIEQ
jgi:raffinose/stachyose/melibiose transport system permease protein